MRKRGNVSSIKSNPNDAKGTKAMVMYIYNLIVEKGRKNNMRHNQGSDYKGF